MKNFIGQARSRDEIVNDVKYALFYEVSNPFRDYEFVMCRYTRFGEIFDLKHILVCELETLIQIHIVPIDYHDNDSDSEEELHQHSFYYQSEDSYSSDSDSGFDSC